MLGDQMSLLEKSPKNVALLIFGQNKHISFMVEKVTKFFGPL
jgi:hypothetical protein